MKLKSVLSVAAIATAMSMSANANLLYDFYISGGVGVGGAAVFADDDTTTHNAQSYSGAFGIDIPLLRLEAEYDYLHSSAGDMQLGMANAYVKFLPGIIQPYIGAGVGMVFDGEYDGADVKNTAAYQGTLGITVNPPVIPFSVDLEGRAIYIPDIVHIGDLRPDVVQYEGRIKLRYTF